MSGRATITAEATAWDESTYQELEDGRKLTRATVPFSFSGDLEGEGVMEFLMCYRPDGTASYVGQQAVSGTLTGRKGGFVVHATGGYADGEASWTWSVVRGSGTEELAGIDGQGQSVAAGGMKSSVTFDYDLE